ncbi:MAG: aldehyde dehydrogenase family protein [Myxococcus sp.]|nr:aldehyde dehydrogenase family protein [Myxococcus sp.]
MTAAVAIPPAMPLSQLEATLKRVRENAATFAKTSLDERIAFLRQLRDGYLSVAEASVRLACAYKGVAFDSPASGEEWLSGPMITLRVLRLTEWALGEVKQYGAPRITEKMIRELPDGRLAIKAFPADAMDAALLAKHVGENYMEPHVTRASLKEHQAASYRKPHDGRLCLVLGAGNVNAIPPTDVVSKMFVEGTVCVLKMNPVNAYLGPLIEQAFAPLVARGFFAVVYGGADEGGFLVNHPAVDEVHITGSDKTHDFMVWGPPGPERDARKARNEPLLKKDISSELGNISPVIVVPGPWDQASLDFQARNTAGMVCNNASFNCTAAKLVVTSRGWAQRQAFLDSLGRSMATGGVPQAYYPGAEQRWKALVEGRPNVKVIGDARPGELPYALIADVDRAKKDDAIFTTEPWCTVISETALEASAVPQFCDEVTAFLNDGVWGTLAANVLVHPETLKDAASAEAVERMVRTLRYGTVAINTWSGAVFGIGSSPWGGHPSTTLRDIQSGRGWVHNTLLLDGIEKFVLRAPAKTFPIAPWFPGHRTQHLLGRRLTNFEYAPSWLKIPGIAAAALRG